VGYETRNLAIKIYNCRFSVMVTHWTWSM